MIIKETASMTETEKRAAQNSNFSYLDIELVNRLISSLYPVGSVYISKTNTNPSEIFGGTWERIKGRFIYGVDDDEEAGVEGGEKTHKLTVEEIPSHQHGSNVYFPNASSGAANHIVSWSGAASNTVSTAVTGGGLAHNNMPPYRGYYIWERTA